MEMQSAEAVAREGVSALARGQRTIIPYFGGRVSALLIRVLPVYLVTWLIEKMAAREVSASSCASPACPKSPPAIEECLR